MYHEQLICPSSFPWNFANIITTNTHVVEVMFSNQKLITNPNKITILCKQQLTLYFARELVTFSLPLISPKTAFLTAVYHELSHIQFADTKTYKEIAINLGSASKSRAVGHACSLNKISIIIPCHRVISATGELTGYAGGLTTKEWLLNHETS